MPRLGRGMLRALRTSQIGTFLRRSWSAALVGVVAVALIVGAAVAKGFPAADVRLNDGSVWVTNRTLMLAGKLNKQIDDLESSTQLFNKDFDLWQDEGLILTRDNVTNQLTQIEPTTASLGTPVLTPAGAQISVSNGRVALSNPSNGRMWAKPAADFLALDFVKSKADFDLGPGGVVTLTDSGEAVAVSAARGELVHWRAGEPEVSKLPAPLGKPLNVQLSAVGEKAVVLDRTAGTIWVEGSDPVAVPDAGTAQLQAPSAAGLRTVDRTVEAVVATQAGLQGLSGAGLVPLAPGAQGTPIQPVLVNGCAYGAFAAGTAASVGIACDRTAPVTHAVQSYSGGSLKYRVNRDIVVLNDEQNGNIWLVTENMKLVNGWQKVAPPKPERGKQTEDDDVVEKVNPDRSGPNRPPVAVDDTFGVRAGRSTMIPVIENDTDPDGDILTVQEPPAINGASLSLVRGGTGLQVTVPRGAEGQRLTFRYTISDGRGGRDSANVTLDVRAERQTDANTAPVRKPRAEPLTLALGAEAEKRVLLDWSDPDGDDLVLVGADAPGDDEVTFTPDGLLTYTDVGTKPGRKEVKVIVSDGVDESEGVLVVDSRKSGDIKPKANGDYYSVAAGDELNLEPLDNDEGDQIALSQVGLKVPNAVVKPNYDDGTIGFSATRPGTYYVGYVISNRSSSFGVIRVDVLPAQRENVAPVATRDLALLPAGGQVLVDPLANDEDADNDVLALQTVSQNPNLRVKMIGRQLLEITATNTPDGPITLNYQVSDGTHSVPGTLVVMPTKPPSTTRPAAVADTMTVRAGDTASLRVLTNDSSPAGLALNLDRKLPEAPDGGHAWVDGEEFRFTAPTQAGEYRAVYQIRDAAGDTASAQVRIYVVAKEVDNTPPEPVAVTGRALAGSKARIIIPLQGTDAEGDAVRLLGIDSGPRLGRIVSVGDRWLEYEAYPGSAGTDSFGYAVTDALGARAVGEIRIGVVPRSATNTPPLAVEDEVTSRPGRVVRVPVFANDSDPDGDSFGFAQDPLHFPGPAQIVDDTVEFTVPDKEGSYVGQYTIIDSRGMESTGDVVITVDGAAPLMAPVARDDKVDAADVATKNVIEVPVLKNDYDPDGPMNAITVSVPDYDVSPDEKAIAAGNNVRVRVGAKMQQIRYQITDADGMSSWAVVTVPGNADSVPALRTNIEPQTVIAGENLDLEINDFVVGTRGRRVQLTAEDRIWANNGTGSAVRSTVARFVSDPAYRGPAALTFEVTDGESPTDEAGRRAVLTIPITVLPPPGADQDPQQKKINQPPAAQPVTLNIGAGEGPKSVDVARAVTDPDGGQLSFTDLKGDLPGGVKVSQDGTKITAEAAADVRAGTIAQLRGEVSDPDGGKATTEVTINVKASSKPPPRAVDDKVDDAQQGKQVPVDVLANDVNPFAPKPLEILSVTVESGGGSAEVSGNSVSVTPSDTFVGTMVVRYQITDATNSPDRRSEARIRLTVKGKPSKPGVPRQNEVGDRRAVLTWTASKDNGSPITGYQVTGTGSNGSKVTQECQSTTCTIGGLTNDVRYRFTVVATNAIGDSEPSGASAEIRPDVKPGPPGTPTTTFGDKQITLAWAASQTKGSAVTKYTIEVTGPAGTASRDVAGGATDYTWSGLQNGSAYRFRVQAHNKAPEPSEWSGRSKAEVPAGPPSPPQNVRAVDAGGDLGRSATVSWNPPADSNGDAVDSYTVYANGSKVAEVTPDKTSITLSNLDNGTSYSFTVSAKNKAGTSDRSGASNSVTPYGAPSPNPTIKLAGGSGQVTATWTPSRSQGAEVVHTVRLSNGAVKTFQGSGTTSTTFSVGAGNSVTATIRACSGSKCTASDTSNQATAYGPPSAPNLSASVSGKNVTFSWTRKSSDNGAAISGYEINTGNGWQSVGGSSHTINGEFGKTYSATLRVTNAHGQTATSNQASGTTESPKVWVSRGDRHNITSGTYKCLTEHCRYVVIHVANFNGNATCTLRDQDGFDWGRSFSVNAGGDGSGRQVTSATYGYPDQWVKATCNGVGGSQVTWENTPITGGSP